MRICFKPLYLVVSNLSQDDGSHSVACEKCNVWQHSKCLGIPQAEAEKDDFHFICKDCKRRIEEANRPKIPPLKFRIPKPAPAPSDAPLVNGEKLKHEPRQNSPVKKAEVPATPSQAQHGIPLNGFAATGPPYANPAQFTQMNARVNGNGQTLSAAHPVQYTAMYQNPSIQPMAAFQAPVATGPGPIQPNQAGSPLKIIQHYPVPFSSTNSATTSFNSQWPTSSNSVQSPLPSPIQNRPSMSPTQGNRDVGPLAGFPTSSQPSGPTVPSTPFGSQARNNLNSGSPYPVGPAPNQSPSLSFSSAATPQPGNSFSHSPPPNHYSPGMAMSGLSPTKQSPARPPTFGGGVGTASILPPIQQLQPSPKLMDRASPDAPIPPPVKSMTPEQEDRRRRENELAAQQIFQQQQQQNQPAAQPNIPPLASSPSQPQQ